MSATVNGATTVATLALAVGVATYPYLPTGDDLEPERPSRDWLWKLDPDLDRSNRAGASRRRFTPRVPDWPTSAILPLLRTRQYPFEGVIGDMIAMVAEALVDTNDAVAAVVATGGLMIGFDRLATLGITRAPGEPDESFVCRVRAVLEAAPYER